MDSRKRCSCFHWFPTDFFKGLTRSVLCSVAYVHLGISILSFFSFMLFSLSFVIFFANPLVRLGPHSSCIVRLAFIEKIENTKILFFWCDIVRQQIDWLWFWEKENSLVPAKASLWTLTFIFYWADFGTSQDKHGTLEWILKKIRFSREELRNGFLPLASCQTSPQHATTPIIPTPTIPSLSFHKLTMQTPHPTLSLEVDPC